MGLDFFFERYDLKEMKTGINLAKMNFHGKIQPDQNTNSLATSYIVWAFF